MLYVLLIVGMLYVNSPSGVAQDVPPENERSVEELPGRLPLRGPVTYVGPDTFILLDQSGRPQKFLGLKYEDFVAALERAEVQRAESNQPRYAIQSLVMEGDAKDGYANLQARLEIRLLSNEPVRVPLGFSGAILKHWSATRQSQPNAETNAQSESDDSYVDYRTEGGGFRVGLRGSSETIYDVILELFVPLESDANSSSIHVECPQAATSRLALDVPAAPSTASVNVGSIVSSDSNTRGGTRFVVLGAQGDVHLTWNTNVWRQSMELASVLSVSGSIRISLDGRSVRSNARLLVQSFGGSFDRFRVRLPPGAELIGLAESNAAQLPTEYTISDVDSAASRTLSGDSGGSGRIVLVQLRQMRTEPIEVHLMTEQPLGLGNIASQVELAGFEVLGALRQYGDVGVYMTEGLVNDWRVEWVVGANARRIEPAELPESMRDADLLAAFQYDRQPWSLRSQISPRETEVHATPRYELTIGSEEARLKTEIDYRIPGARAFAFQVDLNGWELTADSVEPVGIVDRGGVAVGSDGILRLPLAQASSRRTTITFYARRNLSGEEGRLELPFPLPRADSIAPAELVVGAEPSVDLRPVASNQSDLTPLPITSGEARVESGLPHFRYRVVRPDATFAATKSLRPQQVIVEMKTTAKFPGEEVEMEQEFAYDVRNRPVSQLEFEVPDHWQSEIAPIQFSMLATDPPNADSLNSSGEPTGVETHGGREGLETVTLTYEMQSMAGVSDGQATGRQLIVALPHPRLGRFVVSAEFKRPFPGDEMLSPSEVATQAISFLVPQAGELSKHQVHISGPAGTQIQLAPQADSQAWHVTSTPHDSAIFEVATSQKSNLLLLKFEPASHTLWQTAVVERVWLQTWLAGSTRQDRSVYRFRSPGPWVVVELPPEVAIDELEVLLDHLPAEVETQEAGRLQVRLQPTTVDAVHTLELRHRVTHQLNGITRLRWTPPQLVGNRAMCEVYWHVILPSNLHVVRSPMQLTLAGNWAWLGDYWGRKPPLAQPELEQWLNATTQTAPVANEHQYLFTGLIPPVSIQLILAPRWIVVLVASGITLAAGLALAYYFRFRVHWLGLVLIGAGAVLLGMFPASSILVGQAAFLGIFLVAFSIALYKMFAVTAWRSSWPPTGSTAAMLRPAAGSDVHTTTPAGPLSGRKPAVPVRLSDSNP